MYLPNLIPDDHKVLEEYFGTQANSQQSKKRNILNYILSGILLFFAFGNLVNRFFFSFFIICIALMFLPQGKKWLEKNLRFELTNKIKLVSSAIFLLFASLSLGYYFNMEKQFAEKQEMLALKAKNEKIRLAKLERQRKLEAEKLERIRKDSLNHYLNKTDEITKTGNLVLALASVDKALSFAKQEKPEALAIKAQILYQSGKNDEALDIYSNLIKENDSPVLRLKRAYCYSKASQIPEAVADLRIAINAGNQEAEVLHNQINPIIREFSHYITRCCDGDISDATGRGACSHHGGVCGREAVYNEYRKY